MSEITVILTERQAQTLRNTVFKSLDKNHPRTFKVLDEVLEKICIATWEAEHLNGRSSRIKT